VLSQADLGDPNGADYPFLDKLSPAIYLLSNGNIRYIRPLRGEDDVNVYDQFNLDTNLILTFHTTGRLLEPVAKASSTSVNTKDKPTFSVTVADPKTNLGYKWDFGDGRTSNLRKPTHRYTEKGTYSATVTVRGDDGSYGRSSAITMKVAKPPKPPKPPSTSGGGGGGGTGGTVGGGGYIPPYIPSNPGIDLPPTVENPPTDTAPTTPTDDGLEAVEGFVLTGAGAGQGDTIPGTHATSQPTKASELSTSRKIGGAVIGGLAVILLLGLGAEIETRWASTRLAHLRRRV
jgi:PKD repeat protein